MQIVAYTLDLFFLFVLKFLFSLGYFGRMVILVYRLVLVLILFGHPNTLGQLGPRAYLC